MLLILTSQKIKQLRGFALAQVYVTGKWQRQRLNPGVSNPKSKKIPPVLYHSTIKCCPSTIKRWLELVASLPHSVGENQRDNQR